MSSEYKRIEKLLKEYNEEYSSTYHPNTESYPHPSESEFSGEIYESE